MSAQVYETSVIGKAPRRRDPDGLLDDRRRHRRARRSSRRSAAGYDMVDAPVSGGIAAAEGGTLTFMVGGTDEAFARAEPFLAQMGKAVIHAGAAGAGQAAKICNNMLLGATMVATCEAFAMAKKLGLDLQTFYDISSKASGQSWSMTSYCPSPASARKRRPTATMKAASRRRLMLKDLRLAMEAAQSVDAYTPMGARGRGALRPLRRGARRRPQGFFRRSSR